jgi:hypothetical protein
VSKVTYKYSINDASNASTTSKSLSLDESISSDESTSTENVNTNITHQVYYPEFYMRCMTARSNLKELGHAMLKYNWITDELREEIETHYPQPEHFIMDRFKSSCKRDISAFSHHCSKMFPKGRLFASSKQFEQAASHFCTGWRARLSGGGKRVTCHFKKDDRSNVSDQPDLTKKRRYTSPTMKQMINCPFVMRFSLLKIKLKKRDEQTKHFLQN